MAQGKSSFSIHKGALASFSRPTADRTYSSIFPQSSAPGMSNLNEGQTLTYDVVSERGKLAASNIQNV